ncbi:MAG TPA: hypothetical protein VFL16_06370 [Steroidobacteraceae bacterium]|nr:hypothetical protein [Steroidobacteraceae bacterium]
MSEAEKKASPWPWILVPVAAISLFFVLRECRSHLPPATHGTAPASDPAATAEPAPADATSAAAPGSEEPAATAAPETPPAPQ